MTSYIQIKYVRKHVDTGHVVLVTSSVTANVTIVVVRRICERELNEKASVTKVNIVLRLHTTFPTQNLNSSSNL